MVTIDKGLVQCGILSRPGSTFVENAIKSAVPFFDVIVLQHVRDEDDYKAMHHIFQDYPVQVYYWSPEKFIFSEARNMLHSKCTSEWVFHLDDDERVVVYDDRLFSHTIRANLSDPSAGYVSVNIMSPHTAISPVGITSVFVQSRMTRIVRRNLQWHRNLHEIIGNQGTLGLVLDSAVMSLAHLGYDLTYQGLMEKHSRNFKLLAQEIDSNGGSSLDWLHMGRLSLDSMKYDMAKLCFEKALELTKKDGLCNIAEIKRYLINFL